MKESLSIKYGLENEQSDEVIKFHELWISYKAAPEHIQQIAESLALLVENADGDLTDDDSEEGMKTL